VVIQHEDIEATVVDNAIDAESCQFLCSLAVTGRPLVALHATGTEWKVSDPSHQEWYDLSTVAIEHPGLLGLLQSSLRKMRQLYGDDLYAWNVRLASRTQNDHWRTAAHEMCHRLHIDDIAITAAVVVFLNDSDLDGGEHALRSLANEDCQVIVPACRGRAVYVPSCRQLHGAYQVRSGRRTTLTIFFRRLFALHKHRPLQGLIRPSEGFFPFPFEATELFQNALRKSFDRFATKQRNDRIEFQGLIDWGLCVNGALLSRENFSVIQKFVTKKWTNERSAAMSFEEFQNFYLWVAWSDPGSLFCDLAHMGVIAECAGGLRQR